MVEKRIANQSLSIKVKIFMYLIGFCAILLVLLWFFQVVFLDRFYRSVKMSEARNSASMLVKNINDENFDAFADVIAEDYDVHIQVLGEDGQIFYTSDSRAMDKLRKAVMVDNVRPESRRVLLKPQLPMDTPFVVSETVTNQDGESRVLLVYSLISPVNATVNTLRIQLYYITTVMLVFSIILAILIARNVSKPIVAMNEAAKILATGDYDTVFCGSGYKEIEELSDTMNFAAKELAKVEHLRRELIANISHDLRTPLTLISGYAEAMRDLPSENNAENAQVIVDETKRLTSLVNDMLDISKLQSGTQALNMTKFNLTNSINEVINRFSELVRKDGYIIKFTYEGDVFVNADALRISQVFYNLLINAVHFTGGDKSVLVRQSVDENSVTIEVIDSGDGISEESLPYIWDRYYNSKTAHKRAVVGTGIGLSIVKNIILLHGGAYGVRSKIGEGSVFWFRIAKTDGE